MTEAANLKPPPPVADDETLAKLLRLAQALRVEQRLGDSITLFEHLLALRPAFEEAQLGLVLALGATGRTLEALEMLVAIKASQPESVSIASVIREQALPAVGKYNAHLQAGEVNQAERYAAALAALMPQNESMLAAALSCNQALGRGEEVASYARALLALDPTHAAALAALGAPPADAGADGPLAAAGLPETGVHPLVRLRDLHDAASAILCAGLTPDGEAQVERLLQQAREVVVDAPAGSEMETWEKHYRLLMESVDLQAVRDPTPKPSPDPKVSYVTSSCKPLNWTSLRATAAKLGAKAVFFAAADQSYVDLYARWYALSILRHCDVPCLVIVHVIGGAGHMDAIVKSVGIEDERLIYACDDFDAEAITTRCYDAPPKGMAARPIAHFQSARFLRLGTLMQKLQLPVFVSDIDLLLQRGVKDLLQRCAGADVVFNENDVTKNAGSRLTANLLLLNPTGNAALFLRFLRSYLERELARPEVTRWIDQLALVMARHHLWRRGAEPKIDYFNTQTDINNVMYPSYQEHPFRFLSLFHGFDTSSLEGDPRVLGETAKPAGGAPKAKTSPAAPRKAKPPTTKRAKK